MYTYSNNHYFRFILHHSFLVCLEPPRTAEEHISMLAAADKMDCEKTLKIAAHHSFIKNAQIMQSISDEDFMV